MSDAEFTKTLPDGLITRKAWSAVPDGFDSNDPAAPYLKMVGLGCRKDPPDALLLDDNVVDPLIENFRAVRQLVRHFN